MKKDKFRNMIGFLRDVGNSAVKSADKYQGAASDRKSEKGVVLVVVLILSAVALVLVTTLIYIVTVGTQTSGFQKRYRTALEAGVAGADILTQVIELRGDTSTLALLSPVTTVPAACTGNSSAGALYTGMQAKILTSTTGTTGWSADCDRSYTIDPASPTSYDVKFQLGSNPKYNIYAKIVDTVEGNTSTAGTPVATLWVKGVVSSNSGGGEIALQKVPYQYTIEVDAENAANPVEKSKLSVLYQY